MTMSTLRRMTAVLILIAPAVTFAADDKDKDKTRKPRDVEALVGNWVGTLTAPPGIELQMVFRVIKPEGKPISATLDVPDQGAKGLPVSSVELEGDSATFGVKLISGEFRGALSDDGTDLLGKWKQGPASLALTLKKVDLVPERRRPQTPKSPFPYRPRRSRTRARPKG